MKATLDHIGIAVTDLQAALAFYRDALGLDVSAPHEVPTEQVRATFVPVGQTSLELLEATSDTSAIARFAARRGPGIHHLTLLVDDIHAALDRLQGTWRAADRRDAAARRARVGGGVHSPVGGPGRADRAQTGRG